MDPMDLDSTPRFRPKRKAKNLMRDMRRKHKVDLPMCYVLSYMVARFTIEKRTPPTIAAILNNMRSALKECRTVLDEISNQKMSAAEALEEHSERLLPDMLQIMCPHLDRTQLDSNVLICAISGLEEQCSKALKHFTTERFTDAELRAIAAADAVSCRGPIPMPPKNLDQKSIQAFLKDLAILKAKVAMHESNVDKYRKKYTYCLAQLIVDLRNFRATSCLRRELMPDALSLKIDSSLLVSKRSNRALFVFRTQGVNATTHEIIPDTPNTASNPHHYDSANRMSTAIHVAPLMMEFPFAGKICQPVASLQTLAIATILENFKMFDDDSKIATMDALKKSGYVSKTTTFDRLMHKKRRGKSRPENVDDDDDDDDDAEPPVKYIRID